MFKHLTEPFGSYTKHILCDEAAENYLAFVPGFGSCVLELKLNGVSLLDGYKTAAEMEANRWAKNTVLFPFPNRLSNGTYTWDGTDYQFPVNEPISQTALHGFGQDKPMQAYDFKVTDQMAVADCRYKDGGEEVYYPFPFTFSIHFKLTVGALDIEMRFRNDGSADLPVGLGWHPYFTLATRIDDMAMQMPYTELVGVDDRMIPTGKKYAYEEFVAKKRIGATVLDNCFAIPESEGQYAIELEGPEGKMEYWQETGVGKCNFVQVFTPPDRQAVALEPMTCAPDAFNSGDGLARLKPGQVLSARFGMKAGQ